MDNYLSIDIGGTNVKYALLDKAGNILEKKKIKTSHEKETFLQSIDQIVEQYKDKIKGIAFCAPGKIEHTQIRFGGALPFLDGIDLGERYADPNIPVAAINDGKVSVLAENWLGNLKDLPNCAAITLGTGVGGGIIANGQLLNGAHFQAGELSFMILNVSSEVGWDDIAGTRGSAVRMIEKVNHAVGNADETDGLDAFEAINAGDEVALKIFNKFCQDVVMIILNMQSIVDLTTIAIGGGISTQPILIEGINQAYDEFLDKMEFYKNSLTRPKIVEAKFKNDANLFGALYNLLLQVNGEKL